MFKSVFILYLVCFGCYILWTRQPDYFDGVKVPAVITKEYNAGKTTFKARYHTGTKEYVVDADYIFRNLKEGQRVTVIYETGTPEKGAVYTFWGYWLSWGELLMSAILCFLLFQVAVSVTSNPSSEAVDEQMGYTAIKKKKYLD